MTKLKMRLEEYRLDDDQDTMNIIQMMTGRSLGLEYFFKFLFSPKDTEHVKAMAEEFKDIITSHKIYNLDEHQSVFIFRTTATSYMEKEFHEKIDDILIRDANAMLYATDDEKVVARLAIMKMKWFDKEEFCAAADYLKTDNDHLYDF